MSIIRLDWLQPNVQWIKGFFEAGYTRTQIYNLSVEQGWGIRKTDALASLRHFEHIEAAARNAFRSTPQSYKPSEMQMAAPIFDQKRAFLAEATVQRINPVTGEESTFKERMGFDILLTRAEIEAQLTEVAEKYGDRVTKIVDVKLYKRS